jgi:hypothetical protein
MSPHILIDKALEGLEDPICLEGMAVLVQRQINAHMRNNAITVAEFTHYCDRLNRLMARWQRKAA